MPRTPTDTGDRKARFELRLSQTELDAYREAAASNGKSTGAWIRDNLNSSAKLLKKRRNSQSPG